MEIILQFILEPLLYTYTDLLERFAKDLQLKKWQEYLLKISCLVISLTSILLIIIGALLVTDAEPFKTYGTVFLAVGGSVLAIHIFLGLILGTNHVKEETEAELSAYQSFTQTEPTPHICYIEPSNQEAILDYQTPEDNNTPTNEK